MLSPGQKIGGYTLVQKLGEGGMGVVYEAVNPDIGRRVALKVLHPELSQNPLLSRRFLNEARAANQVQHPGLVQVHDFGQGPDGLAYLIMELIPGESLEVRLRNPDGQRLLPALAVALAQQIASALEAAHEKGVVHRDIKPANVMLVPSAQQSLGEQAKVLDFGVAKLLQDSGAANGRTRSGVMVGTAEYMSPEQCRADAGIDAAADVYALGVLLYEMLAGKRPFAAESAVETMTLHLRALPPPLTSLAPKLPPTLIGLVHRMLAKQPADRPSMSVVAVELSRLAPQLLGLRAESRDVSAAPPASSATAADESSETETPTPLRARRRVGWAALAVATTAGVGLVYTLLSFNHGRVRFPRSATPMTSSTATATPVLAAPPPPADVSPALQTALPSGSPPLRRNPAVRPTHGKHQPDAKSDAEDLPLLLRHKEPDGP